MSSASAPAAASAGKNETHDSKNINSRATDIRLANIANAKAIAELVRTSLGPRGMDKMIQMPDGEVLITNDGATIMQHLQAGHPAAKMLVELSKSQDIVAGDGTTSVVILAGAFLEACHVLLSKGIHPMQISEALQAAEEIILRVFTETMAIPLDFADREALIRITTTSLSSKVVSQNSALLAPLCVDAVLHIGDIQASSADLRNIKVTKKLGGTVDDTEGFEGLVFAQKVAKVAGGPTRVEKAKIAVLQTDMENSVVVSDYQQMDRILKEERKYIVDICQAIKKSGANVILLQKSILRDAVSDLALHYLAKLKILLVKDIERDEIEFTCKTLQTLLRRSRPPTVIESKCVLRVPGINIHLGKIVKITGVPQPCKTMTILCRGSNKMTLDENERSIHDALCVMRALYQKRFLVPGGGAPEAEAAYQLGKAALEAPGCFPLCFRAFAEAMEVIPSTLAENSGMHPISLVTELRKRHAEGHKYDGINAKKGSICNMYEENVVQVPLPSALSLPLHVILQTMIEWCVRMILKIDDIIVTNVM